MVTIQLATKNVASQLATASVAVQIACDSFEIKENAQNVHGYLSTFDDEIGRIGRELNGYAE